MSTEHPALADIVREVIGDAIADCAQLREGVGGPTTAEIINRYAEAAGDAWDQSRIIHTVEQLDALPNCAVVLDGEGSAWAKDDEVLNPCEGTWFVCGFEVPKPADAVLEAGDALLIHHPGWAQS